MWICVCALFYPCLTLRESVLSIPGVGGFQPKGKTNSRQAFMKRMMMYGEVEHRIPKRPLAFFFFFFFLSPLLLSHLYQVAVS